MLRFKSIKNKIVIISLIITTLTFISVCLMTLMQIDKELQGHLKTEIELAGNLVSQKMLASINKTVGIMDNVKKSIENGNTDTESIWICDEAIMLIFCNINSYVNHKNSPLQTKSLLLEQNTVSTWEPFELLFNRLSRIDWSKKFKIYNKLSWKLSRKVK